MLLLWLIWSGAILGVLFRLLWTDAPRWLYVPIYIALGCGALFYLPQFFPASVPAAVLICVGGALYIAGAVFYALKKPNFSYSHFGFHELFHAFTVFAFAAHFMAIAHGRPGLGRYAAAQGSVAGAPIPGAAELALAEPFPLVSRAALRSRELVRASSASMSASAAAAMRSSSTCAR